MAGVPDARDGGLTRRRLLQILGGGALVGGASALVALRDVPPPVTEPAPAPALARSPAPTSQPTRTAATTSPRAAPTTPPPLVTPPPYEPLAGEYLPEAKRLAAAVVTALTTHDPGTQPGDLAQRAASTELVPGGVPVAPALATPEGLGALAATVAPLVAPDAVSSGAVVYPQLGGDTPTSCAIMTVVRQTQRFGDGRPDAVTTRTLDIRLGKVEGVWGLESVASIGGVPVPAPPGLPETALAVLSDARIDLPDTARWDVHAGRIDLRVLATMRLMADLAPFSVCVLATGHPVNVFGTATQSNHTPGRAVDVWAVNGQPVVLQQPSEASKAFAVVRSVYDAGEVTELGSPWDLDQPGGGRSFRNDVHRDHLHVAFGG